MARRRAGTTRAARPKSSARSRAAARAPARAKAGGRASRASAAGKQAADKSGARRTAGKKTSRRSVVRKQTARRRGGGGSRGGGPRETLRWLGRGLAIVAFVSGVWLSSWILRLDRVVAERFEGRTFNVPSKVYSAPLIVYPGMDWQRIDLRGWLVRLSYREAVRGGPLEAGRYTWRPGELRVHLRAFDHPLRPEPARDLALRLGQGVIQEIVEVRTGESVDVVVLEPEPVSAFLGSDREQRDLVHLEDLPRHLIAAVYAVEDRRFEEHHGVDLRRVMGAMLVNLRAGRIEQGASTLTQQLVKNFFLTPDRTFNRKLQEVVMALIVEARYEKAEILEAYLNEIYLGQRGATQVHGVGEAARLYFGKSAADLSVSESALLAAIIQSPNGISPHRRPERAVARRDLVLELMRDQGYVSERGYRLALAEPLNVAAVTQDSGEVRYFLDLLSQQLPEVYDETVLASEGLRIYSTIDPRLQRAAARSLRSGLERIEALMGRDPATDAPLQGCLLAMRPQTGELLALVGGRDYGLSQWNRCTQARRQVGSVFKPFVYVAALDRRSGPAVTLASRLVDEPLEVPTIDGVWRPENYDHQFRGDVSVRDALERSLNVPAVRLGQQVGIDRVIAVARALGIRSPLPEVPSLALGTAELSPLEVARAYATLANGGRRPTPRSFVDVVETDGLAHENRPLEGSVPAIDPATAYLAVTLLQGVVDRGTGVRVRSSGMTGPIAGKTGTTDEEFDLWFVGFTPELVAVVWVGFDEPATIGLPSSQGALPIWTDFVRDVTGSHVRGAFPRPSGLEEVAIEPSSGARAMRGCPERQNELFLRGTAPRATCPPGVHPPGDDEQSGVIRRTLRRLFGP
ncbi:MAG: PBP1A family penicillin-binding protein [Deltaproteobacteria bacterium]|nr:PBP1A family penicillin-binding protein [Deltaproteobacteria bacterium]